MKEIYR